MRGMEEERVQDCKRAEVYGWKIVSCSMSIDWKE